jgi:L-threonylcarbamoyladenylate synthase
MEILKLQQKSINKIVEFLNGGGVVVFPTDTVYGFLADAQNKKAVEKIYKIKKRPKLKPLAVFVKDLKMAKELAEINEKQ